MDYSIPKTENTARAYGQELRCSPKHCVEISREIRGMDLGAAKAYLRRVQNQKQAVPFKRHNRGVGHRRGGGPGRYPEKAAGKVLEVLESAEGNAVEQGLDGGSLKVEHIAAHRGRTFEGWTPRAFGRSSPKNRRTTNLEVVLKER
ncbi:MAG: 50S ribosomal protein L22 [Methanonatronarchaeales archaeon]|nr:50S ribosomal protein L22 [Methanonatronarchaeales archaeon]